VATTVERLVELLIEITGSSLEPVYASVAGGVHSTTGAQLNFSRAKIDRLLDWRPEVDLEQGLRRLIDWRRAQHG
jgi:UDP-glucose 4-epimerase